MANPDISFSTTGAPSAPRVAAAAAHPRATPGLARDLLALTKPRITFMVLLTEAAGASLAPTRPSARAFWLSVVGTALIVASANTLNMWLERDVDALMTRTRNRPLPAGRLSPDVALAFGVLLGVVSVPLLFLVNLTTGLLGLLALVTYVGAYTPLKRHTHLALYVGAVPGAIPPLLGWSTATGAIGPGAVLLFAVLYLWQVPHFAAISLFRSQDYARAGLQVVSTQRGERAAANTIAVSTAVLVGTSLLFTPFGVTGWPYTVAAGLLGAGFLGVALWGFAAPRRLGPGWAKAVFAYSIPYLTVLLAALLADRRAG